MRLPLLATSHLGRLISCGKFVFPSLYLPLPILDVPSPVVNSSSHLSHDLPRPILGVPSPLVNSSSHLIHLITCHFPSWKSHLLLGSPISCGKFVFPSQYLPLPILEVPSRLEVPCHVVNSSSHLITCHFPSWTSHLLW